MLFWFRRFSPGEVSGMLDVLKETLKTAEMVRNVFIVRSEFIIFQRVATFDWINCVQCYTVQPTFESLFWEYIKAFCTSCFPLSIAGYSNDAALPQGIPQHSICIHSPQQVGRCKVSCSFRSETICSAGWTFHSFLRITQNVDLTSMLAFFRTWKSIYSKYNLIQDIDHNSFAVSSLFFYLCLSFIINYDV